MKKILAILIILSNIFFMAYLNVFFLSRSQTCFYIEFLPFLFCLVHFFFVEVTIVFIVYDVMFPLWPFKNGLHNFIYLFLVSFKNSHGASLNLSNFILIGSLWILKDTNEYQEKVYQIVASNSQFNILLTIHDFKPRIHKIWASNRYNDPVEEKQYY